MTELIATLAHLQLLSRIALSTEGQQSDMSLKRHDLLALRDLESGLQYIRDST